VMNEKLRTYLKENWQYLVNIYLFLNFLGWTLYHAYTVVKENRVNYVEVSFMVQNVILTSLVIVRRPHKGIDRNVMNQLVAIVAFMSGALFYGQPATNYRNLVLISGGFVFASNFIGVFTLLNLGRSFGILIAVRQVKTSGLYSVIRHPMYLTDILLRIGYLVSHCNFFTVAVFVVSTGCYVWRSVLEERFLSQYDDYRDYMKRVRYRFIPFIF
jgi:protein-S-isoprenylcysteine O-methyltransferase Ste14